MRTATEGDAAALSLRPQVAGAKDLTARVFSLHPLEDYRPPTLTGHRQPLVAGARARSRLAGAARRACRGGGLQRAFRRLPPPRAQPTLPAVHFTSARLQESAGLLGKEPPALYTVSADGALFGWAYLQASGQQRHEEEAGEGMDADEQQQQQQSRVFHGGHWKLKEKHYFNQRGAKLTGGRGRGRRRGMPCSPLARALQPGITNGECALCVMPAPPSHPLAGAQLPRSMAASACWLSAFQTACLTWCSSRTSPPSTRCPSAGARVPNRPLREGGVGACGMCAGAAPARPPARSPALPTPHRHPAAPPCRRCCCRCREGISSLAFNAGGDWVAVGSAKLGQLLVWEWRSESYALKQQGHYFDVAAVAFSPDGALLVTGADDAKVRASARVCRAGGAGR